MEPQCDSNRDLVYLERPIEDHLVGGVELSEDVVLDVLNIFAKVQKVAEFFFPDELLDGVLPLEVVSDPGQVQQIFEFFLGFLSYHLMLQRDSNPRQSV